MSTQALELVKQLCDIYSNYDFATEVIVASVRRPEHVVQSACWGAHIATVPFKVMDQMFGHPLTEKGIADAKKSMKPVRLKGQSIPHKVVGRHGASSVVLVPASDGTGVIAGKKLRPLLELAGIHNVLTKAYGSTSAKNLLKAGVDALKQLRSAEEIASLRGVTLS